MRRRRGTTLGLLAAGGIATAVLLRGWRPAPGEPAAPGPPAPPDPPAAVTVTFVGDVAPLFARHGCATAQCHGAAGGRGGLRLALFGGDLASDYDALVRGAKGRRIDRIEPGKSLLLDKTSGALPHPGRALAPPGSPAHALLRAWLAQGAPFGDPQRARATGVTAAADLVTLKPHESQPLRIAARFADAAERDVTRLAVFTSLDPAVATVDADGRVAAVRCGQTYVVAGFDRQAAVVRVVVPQDLPGGFPAVRPQGRIDELVCAKLKELGIPPADLCSDEVFLRRVFLDVIGILPTPDEARAFLADTDPARRAKLIDRLLGRDEFADYWTLKWGDLLRIKSEYPVRVWPKAVAAYSLFLHHGLAANQPYDQFVRALLLSSGSNFRDGAANFYRAVPSKDPQSFAENTALLFMGARMGCAHCHAHPQETWSRADNLALAAFFGNVRFKATGEWKEEIVYADPEAVYRDPRTKEIVKPRFPGGAAVEPAPGEDLRARFAAWLTAPDNPWFARNIANRVWYWLLGRGIVHEPDDLRPTNPPSNPALLDHLARELVDHRYDLKYLYRIVLNSRTYQAASTASPQNGHDTTHFSHYLVKRMGAEQLLDALSQVTETTETVASQVPEPYTRLIDYHALQLTDGSVGTAFLELFGRPPRDTPFETERCNQASMHQAMHLLNSSDIDRKVTASARLKRLLKENRTDAQIVEELYLAAFARFPTDAEKRRVLELVGKDKKLRAQALTDLLWALVNAKEFVFNH